MAAQAREQREQTEAEKREKVHWTHRVFDVSNYGVHVLMSGVHARHATSMSGMRV